MARTIVFPSRNNVTYRSGFIKLTAFGSEFDQAAIEGNTEGVVDQLKQTARIVTPDFEEGGMPYLENAIKNMQSIRSKMSGKVKLIAILPIPLAIKDTTPVEWSPAASSFIDGAYGKVKETSIGMASTYATGSELFNQAGGLMGMDQLGTDLLGAANSTGVISLGSNQNSLVERINTGSNELSKSIAASPQIQAYIKPGAGTKQILGMKTDANLMMFHNEAAALNGTRQIIFDPGYWQEFKGVSPRSFELTWDIIPENHDDAINGLELCARLREFSLPQSVSGVELLSPCYWWVDWSNKYLDSQTLYSNLIINNVSIDYAQDGEWHGASTPKMFRITLSFQEAKAPTADLYKNGDNFIPVSVSASGPAGSSGSTGALDAITGIAGNAGNTSSIGGITLPNIPGFPSISLPDIGGFDLGDIDKIFGDDGIFSNGVGGVLTAIKGQVSDALVGILGSGGDKIGEIFGSKIGGAIGEKVDATINGIASSVGETLKNAIETGDFKDLDQKIRDEIIAEAKTAATGISEDILDGFQNEIEDIIDKLPTEAGGIFNDIFDDIRSGNFDPALVMDELTEKLQLQIKDIIGEEVLGIIGNAPPEYEEIIKRIIDLTELEILDSV